GRAELLDQSNNVIVAIDGIRFSTLSAAAGNSVDDWLYEAAWRPSPDSETDAGWAGTHCLVLAEAGGVGDAIAADIEARGGMVWVATRGESFVRSDDRRWHVRPNVPGDYDAIIEALATAAAGVPPVVIYLWSIDAEQRPAN